MSGRRVVRKPKGKRKQAEEVIWSERDVKESKEKNRPGSKHQSNLSSVSTTEPAAETAIPHVDIPSTG